jgi:hypothetical protein
MKACLAIHLALAMQLSACGTQRPVEWHDLQSANIAYEQCVQASPPAISPSEDATKTCDHEWLVNRFFDKLSTDLELKL